jgi:hypothetical protein
VGGGGDLLAEVAEADLDGSEQLAVGGVGEGVGHLVDQGQGLGAELLAEALPALVARFNRM